MKELKTLIFKDTQYEIVDEKAREDIANIKLTGGVANYTGKKILFMGDSIVRQSSVTSGWVGIFNEIIKPASFVNTAVSGANWSEFSTTEYDGNPTSDVDANNVIGNQVEKIARGKDTTNANYSEVAEYADFDIIIIAAGINDYTIGADEPEIEASFTSDSTAVALSALDKKVFASAFRYCIETLRSLYPNSQIFVCTPTQTASTYRTYASVKGKRDHIIALCERMSVTCIDTFMCGIYGINENDGAEGLDLIDGVHPNDSGKSKIAKYNAREVVKHYIADTSDTSVNNYTNLVTTSIDATGDIFNGTGYQDNVRINSSGEVSTSEATNTTSTGFIKVSGGDVVRIKNCEFLNSINGQNANAIGVYDSAKNHLGTTTAGGSVYGIFGSTYMEYKFSSVVEETTGVYKWVVPPTESGVEWVRLSCYTGANGADLIVTVNEEIT